MDVTTRGKTCLNANGRSLAVPKRGVSTELHIKYDTTATRIIKQPVLEGIPYRRIGNILNRLPSAGCED